MRKSTLRAVSVALAAVAAGVVPAAAQQPEAEAPVGRIVAVAADSAIFSYDLDLRVFNHQQLPPEGPQRQALRLTVLDSMVNELLMVQAALRDTSIVIDDGAITARADASLAEDQQRLGGPAAYQRELEQAGFTVESFRRMRVEQVRRAELRNAYLRKAVQERTPPPVSATEVRGMYADWVAAGRIPPRPAMITFDQIVLPTAPSDTAMASALAEAAEALTQARAGEDWTTLVRRHSDEPGAGESGGSLGWFRRGEMVRAFEQAVYNRALRPGDIVGPVASPFGLHIIRLDKIRGPERQASHILIRPTVTDEDVQRSREKAVALADSLRAGTRVGDLQERYHDDSEIRRVGPEPRDSIRGPYAELRAATEGAVVGPLRLDDPRTGTRWVVARVASVEEAGQYTFDEVRPQLEQLLQQSKLEAEIVAELRRRMYVDIRIR